MLLPLIEIAAPWSDLQGAPTGTAWGERHGGEHAQTGLPVNEPTANTFPMNQFNIIFWIIVVLFL